MREQCKVCMSPAADHIHYGAICCFSCRAFFRRGPPKIRLVFFLRALYLSLFTSVFYCIKISLFDLLWKNIASTVYHVCIVSIPSSCSSTVCSLLESEYSSHSAFICLKCWTTKTRFSEPMTNFLILCFIR